MWEKSQCKGSQLHDYRIVKGDSKVVTEICRKCHDRQFFKTNVPDKIYMSFHLKSALQRNHPRFKKEYAS